MSASAVFVGVGGGEVGGESEMIAGPPSMGCRRGDGSCVCAGWAVFVAAHQDVVDARAEFERPVAAAHEGCPGLKGEFVVVALDGLPGVR